MFSVFLVSKFVKFSCIFNKNLLNYNFYWQYYLYHLILNFNYFVDNKFIIFNMLCFFKKISNKFLKNFKNLLFIGFNLHYFSFKVYKAYGINMRILRLNKRKKKNIFFLRLGYSHGFLLNLSKIFFFRVFKRRYFLIAGNNLNFLNQLNYQLRFLRFFFQYKLIGIKSLRDYMQIKTGKKKNF